MGEKKKSIIRNWKIAREYGLKTEFELDNFNKIFIPSDNEFLDGWYCEYPKLDEIMEKYDLFNEIELIAINKENLEEEIKND